MYTYLYIYIYIQRIASVVFLSSSIISVYVAPCSDDDKQQKRLCLVLQGKIQTSLPVICARMLYDCHLPHTPRPLPPLMVVVYGVARTTVTCSVVEAVFLYIMHEPCRCTFTWRRVKGRKSHPFEKYQTIILDIDLIVDLSFFLFFYCYFFFYHFFSFPSYSFFFLLTCQSGHGTNMTSPCPF